jgi:hypothetical protein
MQRLLILLLLACYSMPASADEISICYNYGCAVQATVIFTGKQLQILRNLFQKLPDAVAERAAIAKAIGLCEIFSGEQTPTQSDRGGNVNDDGLEGRMDCIDHSHNSTAYLKLLEGHGWLAFHRVLEPVKRAPFLVNDHWGARVQEKSSQREFIVDSWFFDNGLPAAIFSLDDWMSGATPDDRTPHP